MTLKATNIYILGSGHFGQRAAILLQKQIKDGSITVVDRQPKSLAVIEAAGCKGQTMEAVDFLTSRADQILPDHWIVPAVPLHLAYAWLQAMLKSGFNLKEIPVPRAVGSLIPNAVWGDKAQVYTSIATFRCPENCPEPQNKCTVTGKPRPQILWQTLASLNIPGFRSICIRSYQLAPGVGGFQFKSLQRARQMIETNPGRYLISTACKCHGVINGLAHDI